MLSHASSGLRIWPAVRGFVVVEAVVVALGALVDLGALRRSPWRPRRGPRLKTEIVVLFLKHKSESLDYNFIFETAFDCSRLF